MLSNYFVIVTHGLTQLLYEIQIFDIWVCDLDIDLSRSLKVICDSVIELPIYGFLVISYSNTWANSDPLRDISLRNPSDLDVDLSSSLRSNVMAPMDSQYMYMLSYNNNIWPNSAALQDMMLQNLSDLEFDLSMPIKVKCDVIGLAIHGFLLTYTVITCLTLTT